MLIHTRRPHNAPNEVVVPVADRGYDRAMLVLQYAIALVAAGGAFLLARFR